MYLSLLYCSRITHMLKQGHHMCASPLHLAPSRHRNQTGPLDLGPTAVCGLDLGSAVLVPCCEMFSPPFVVTKSAQYESCYRAAGHLEGGIPDSYHLLGGRIQRSCILSVVVSMLW